MSCCARCTTAHQFIWRQWQKCGPLGGSSTRLCTFTPYPSPWKSSDKNSVGPTPLHKWGMAATMTYECGEEDQTVDNVVFQFPIHRPPHGLHVAGVAWPDCSGWWDNRLAAQQFHRYLARPSSGLKELAQTTMLMKQLVLAYCRHSHLIQLRCAIFASVE